MRRILLLAVMALVVAACGNGTDATTTTTTVDTPTTTEGAPDTTTTSEPEAAEFPVTIEDDLGSVTIEERPESIVSLSATGTEMLFEIGAGPQVVAVDSFSYYPEGTPVTDLSGFEPSLEGVLSFEPDLVVASYDPENILRDGLAAVDIPLILFDTASDIDSALAQIEALGAATGNLEVAGEIVENIEADLADSVASAGGAGEGLDFLHDSGASWAATGWSFAGQIYELFGMVNIADEAEGAEFGFIELSSEYVIEADPTIIFNSGGFESLEDIASRPGWGGLSAVENDSVVFLDPDISSRWGPRMVDFARDIADALNEHG